MEGGRDPFNRRTYPWGRENEDFLNHFKRLGRLRKDHPALRRGDIRYLAAEGHLLAFARTAGGETLVTALNLGDTPLTLALPAPGRVLAGEGAVRSGPDGPEAILPPVSGTVLALLNPAKP